MTTPSGLDPTGATPDKTLLGDMTFGDYAEKTQEDWELAIDDQWAASATSMFDFGSFIQELPLLVVISMLQMLADLLDNVPIVGTVLSEIVEGIANALNSTNAKATTTESALPSVKSNTPLHTGVDPSDEVTVPYSTTFVSFTVNQSNARGGFVRFQGGDEKRVFTWRGSGNASITHAYLDIYQMDATTGDLTLFHQSPDLAGILLSSAGWHQYSIDSGTDGYISVKDDIVYVELRVTGGGSHTIYGKTLTAGTTLSGLHPAKNGGVRDGGSSTTSPATIDVSTSLTFTDDVPFFSCATDHGQDEVLREWIDTFERANGGLGANWWNKTTAGSNYLEISSQTVRFKGTTDGEQSSGYVYPLATDNGYLEINFIFDGSASARAGGFMCGNNAITNAAYLLANESTVYIATGTFGSVTNRASVSHTAAAGDNIGMYYVAATNTFEVYKNGGASPILEWEDTGNVVSHGLGNRFVGLWMERTPFNSAGSIGKFIARDIAV